MVPSQLKAVALSLLATARCGLPPRCHRLEVIKIKGLNNFKVYHFGSITTRKKNNLKQNRGDRTFLKKWGITTKFFKKYYLKSKTKYDGPLKTPKFTLSFFIDFISCKIRSIFTI